uniref:Uncharacterized protein n=1 Tax=Ananas comosus var. bracteatus TaxID=296719 RepID=A0A6V7P4I7_ANACO|nr:unnamed protein product [Ananas comosus var. bracteatus]
MREVESPALSIPFKRCNNSRKTLQQINQSISLDWAIFAQRDRSLPAGTSPSGPSHKTSSRKPDRDFGSVAKLSVDDASSEPRQPSWPVTAAPSRPERRRSAAAAWRVPWASSVQAELATPSLRRRRSGPHLRHPFGLLKPTAAVPELPGRRRGRHYCGTRALACAG